MAYRNRTEAGESLAGAVAEAGIDQSAEVVVLGVARGGVPVARPVADHFGVALDVAVARKLGAPGNPEFAIGAVAADGVPLVDREIVRRLGIPETYVAAESSRQQAEVARRLERYRGNAPERTLTDRVVIVVDDGVATGATLIAVLRAVRREQPRQLVCAVPVGPPDTIRKLEAEADLVVCPLQPRSFLAVGTWYRDFSQTSDREVEALLG